jgi:hypothetical protein
MAEVERKDPCGERIGKEIVSCNPRVCCRLSRSCPL